jgi:NAD(P)-dependent dehydrogenase (short-subunit alcohol dehydrogenase family)
MRSDNCVLITGATGQLAEAVIEHFDRRGTNLALLARDGNTLAARARQVKAAPTLLLAVDLLDARAVAAAVGQAVARFGGIDAAIHLAGGFTAGQLVHETTDAWQRMLDVNVNTMLHSAAAVVPVMRRQRRGFIVNVGAASAARGAAGMGAYSAAKSALMRLTESMSAELRGEGINVNAVLPTVIDTPANRAAMPDADFSRWVSPGALASVIGFLASDDASAVHGAGIPVG